MWTSKGEREIADAHLEIRKRNDKFKVCVIATNARSGKLMWCDAGPASTRTTELIQKWKAYDVEKRSSFGSIEAARDFAQRMLKNAPLDQTVALHSGLQEPNPPEFVETIVAAEPEREIAPLPSDTADKIEALILNAKTKAELEALGGISDDISDLDLEGARTYRLQQLRERSDGNRLRVLKAKGHLCEVCGFDFESQYDGLPPSAHVHHKEPLALGERKATSVDEFAVLCSPCHTAAHMGQGRRLRPRTIEELRAIVRFVWERGEVKRQAALDTA